MSGTYKKFRSEDISITPFDAHKDYLVYIDNFTGSYYEPYYEQSRIFDHQITSSAPLVERIVSLSVHSYDSEHDESDFMPKVLGKYGVVLSGSTHDFTTNGWYRRAIHDSLQGMYYTNPDDPCYTLDNSGYEKEFRTLNYKAQVISVPQRMAGNNIKKGSLKIQSGSGVNRITLRDDGYGNIYDETVTGSDGIMTSLSYIPDISSNYGFSNHYDNKSISFVRKESILSLDFNDLHNEKNKKISAISINRRNTYSQKDGDRFKIKNRTRFFERSRYSNLIRAHNVTPTTHSAEGTFIYFDGLTKNPTTNTKEASESRYRPENQSMMTIQHEPWHDLRQNDNYTITMRISCSAHQPSSESINKNGPYNFILSKFNNSSRGGFPFSIRYCNANANGGVGVNDSGVVGGIQACISDGITANRANSTASVVGRWVDVAVVKHGSSFELWIDGHKNSEVPVPPGQINNDDPIVVGARTAWKGGYTKKADASNLYSRKTRPAIEYFRNFQGGISNINMFPRQLHDNEIKYGTVTKGTYTNLVGNVFYNHGLVTITSLSNRYSQSAFPMLSCCTLSFQNTHTIFEHEYACHIKEREYTYTMNPSIVSESKFGTLMPFTTGSSWSPYVTSIGLYDRDAQLLATGKLSRPIKKSNEYDTTFVVTFDT